jgi:hypothetical protein
VKNHKGETDFGTTLILAFIAALLVGISGKLTSIQQAVMPTSTAQSVLKDSVRIQGINRVSPELPEFYNHWDNSYVRGDFEDSVK